MRPRRSSLLRILVWMCLFLLAVRPVARIEEGVGWATSPLRLLAEVGSPLAWFSGRRAHAAEGDQSGLARESSVEIEALADELLALARPTRPELLEGRDAVPAEVIGRAERDPDRLLARVADTTAIVPGLPVVYGNVYVGRVAGVDPEEREVRIDLVTGPRFAVGARLSDASPPIWMTVGGVFAGRNRRSRTVERLALVARNPSDREAPEGRVEVGELLPDIDPWAHLAEGFELGTLVRVPRSDERVVLAEIDYGAGLYHVHVLCPEGSRAGARSELELAISDLDWRPTRRLAAGDPSSWRGATKIAAGRSAGVEPGAAVISGLRLVGRVERAGEWSSDVRLLGDPGLRLVAVARVAGESRPRVLGRLVSLGPDPSGAWIRFRWEAVVGVELPLQGSGSAAAEATVEARLFSGAGDSGLPVGLFLGEARLSTAVDPSVGAPVVLLRHDDRLGPGNLWVRTARERRP